MRPMPLRQQRGAGMVVMREHADQGTFEFGSATGHGTRTVFSIAVDDQLVAAAFRPKLAAIETRSASESAFILRMT